MPAEHVLGDKGYDSAEFRDAIHARDAQPVIPPRKTSPQVPCDYALYCERNLVDVDQSWRLSRIRLREVGLVMWRRESSPRWWCCTHSLELCDGVGVGVYKLGRAAAGCWNVAA